MIKASLESEQLTSNGKLLMLWKKVDFFDNFSKILRYWLDILLTLHPKLLRVCWEALGILIGNGDKGVGRNEGMRRSAETKDPEFEGE